MKIPNSIKKYYFILVGLIVLRIQKHKPIFKKKPRVKNKD